MRRTMLFLPGNNPNMMMNGGLLGADSIIFDLEDAVAPDQKDAARDLVKQALTALDFGRCERIIRINALDTPYWETDLEEMIPLRPAMIMPTKVSGAEYIRKLDQRMSEIEAANGLPVGEIRLIPLLETTLGIENAYGIATASPRMEALYLGAEDLTADLRCGRTKEGAEIAYARGRLVCAARAAGIEAYDTPFTDVEDMEGLEADARLAKGLGYTGKAVISPRHVDCVNRVFSPSPQEIAYARDVFEAIRQAKEQGKGAISLRGKMIDAPIVQRARLVLEAASEIEGVNYL
ncbi:HpcH/HpaI aldolase/citrate lyase family protein [Enterocloster lavalensis]|uniref:HpcH/HpaI aldolase/citrate lyase family protein n=1 Tax=Enterocloster lavalensis TaxID=460384 RepID=UPI000D1BFC8C|nr:aldolase/citrate lyase family protein [Enterocloster lavalensis]PST34461.1 CoA ester lyase [Enterocloster lavalensis]